MANGLPAKYNFDPHYKGDGLGRLLLRFRNKFGTLIDFTGSTAIMQLRVKKGNFIGPLIWEFTTETIDVEHKLVINDKGEILFPQIDKWDLPTATYNYDLRIIDSFGNRRAFIEGLFPVNQDISR